MDQEGTLTKNITQESVQEAIFTNIHQKWFSLANLPPYAGVGSKAALVIMPSQEKQGPFSMDHTLSLPTSIKPRGNDSHWILLTPSLPRRNGGVNGRVVASQPRPWNTACTSASITLQVFGGRCTIASLVFQAVHQDAVVSLLSTIQDMKYFPRTGFGDSQM